MRRRRRSTDADAEAGSVLGALRRIVRRLRLVDRQAQAQHGLSAAQLFVLHNLAQAPGASIGDLARRSFTDQSSVSTVVARLVAVGLVARRSAPTDRRRSELELTVAGAKIVRGAPRLPQTHLVEALRVMPAARRRAIARALELLSTALGADTLEPTLLFEDEKGRHGAR
jgi:DNA-binding MarR family transcriptional regulator